MIAGVVLSASEDGMLRLWESRSGNFIATIAAYQSAFAGMATSEDDGHILTGSNDGTCSFWDVPSRRCVYTATLGHGILSMAADRANERTASFSFLRGSPKVVSLSAYTKTGYTLNRRRTSKGMAPAGGIRPTNLDTALIERCYHHPKRPEP